MNLPSEALGPALLSTVLAAATAIALHRRGRPPYPAKILPLALIALGLQALHVAEEFGAGFQHDFPLLFGLPPWSASFFVAFNLVWIALWSFALGAIASGRPSLAAMAAVWFLALAAMGNALWHPLLCLATGEYFPGVASALPLGCAGLLLVKALLLPGCSSTDGLRV